MVGCNENFSSAVVCLEGDLFVASFFFSSYIYDPEIYNMMINACYSLYVGMQ